MIPPAVPSETDPLAAEARRILKTVFGHDRFREHQEDAIRHVASGRDAFVLMPTGGGKSLCYQIPALLRPGVGMVVSPLIALMRDQTEALETMGIRARFINSSLTPNQVREVERQALAGQINLLYVAPERLAMSGFQALLDRLPLSLIAIDEAHCVSAWGHDFRPEYLAIANLTRRFAQRPVAQRVPRIALTATAGPDTLREILDRLELSHARRFVSSFDRPNIHYSARPRKNGMAQMTGFIRDDHPGQAGLVYCLTRKQTERAAAVLNDAGIPALVYHAGLDPGMRTEHQRRFLREEGLVMAATVAFGMGIDKPDVRFVVHLGMPPSVESYYQETGRAGRDGLPAEALLLYSAADLTTLRLIGEKGGGDRRLAEIRHRKVEVMLRYCETVSCRRRLLLECLGETLDRDCGRCDACDGGLATWDATEAARKLLSCVYRTGQRFGGEHVIDVLLGEVTDKVKSFGHDRVSTFGIGQDLGRGAWRTVLRKLRADGLLFPDPERYYGLVLTPASTAVLRGEERVNIRQEAPKSPPSPRAARTMPSATAPDRMDILTTPALRDLWERLRALRLELARASDVPPYVVFHDTTLLRMVAALPVTPEELLDVPGVGEKKREKFGDRFLELLAAHVVEHGRPEPVPRIPKPSPPPVLKPAVQRNGGDIPPSVLATLELFRNGADIDAIARERGLSPVTVGDHLEKLVAAGRIDAGEVLRLSPEDRREIEAAFQTLGRREDGGFLLKPVFEHFGERHGYDTLKFVRAGLMSARAASPLQIRISP